MAEGCLLYYITDRAAFPGDELTRQSRLLEKIAEAAYAGVDYIQLREKDLPTRNLEQLAREAAQTIRGLRKAAPDRASQRPAFLVNSRVDVAIACQADGVHLRSEDISPREVRGVWTECAGAATTRANSSRDPQIGVSCHTSADVIQAASAGATFAVFAPVFEKKDIPGIKPAGLAHLSEACKSSIPVLALGGVTLENAKSCITAGAAGIAAIRLFQENDIVELAHSLRSNS